LGVGSCEPIINYPVFQTCGLSFPVAILQAVIDLLVNEALP
jgi:hypothetical protein